MKPALRRTLRYATIGLVILLLAPFALAGIDVAMITMGMNDDEATASLPAESQSITIRRRPIWSPMLGNEFRRSIILSSSGHELLRAEIQPDTGGYALVQLFEAPEGKYLLTDGLSCYQVDLRHRDISEIPVADSSKLVFVGAFNEDSADHRFQFASSTQQPPQPFGYTGLDWCLSEQRR
jgi:hypothetical protein